MILKEQQQLRKIRKGDVDTFENLFHQFYAGLCGYAEILVNKPEVAEEVVQDVFYNIWKNRESLQIQRSLQSYLYRSVYNNSMMYLRKMKRERFLDDGNTLVQVFDSPDPSQLLLLNEVSELVSDTLDQLPERTREIFRLNRQTLNTHASSISRLLKTFASTTNS